MRCDWSICNAFSLNHGGYREVLGMSLDVPIAKHLCHPKHVLDFGTSRVCQSDLERKLHCLTTACKHSEQRIVTAGAEIQRQMPNIAG